ncbi:MAG: hypothetical protein HOM71_09885, partial [Deltaproteobacteria bacterium]|nr:hypothetical protein [Deltaproteobacteria bacterium]
YVNPKDIGPATKTPYRQASLEESYSVAVMEKGTRVKWVGNDRSTWNIALKQYELDGKWVDAKDPDYRMGLDFEEVMNKGNLPKGIAEPDGSKGFVITNTKTGKVKWDGKPKETDISGKSIGQKSDDDVMRVDMNTVSYGLASQMRKNLLFLDPDITVTTKRNFIGPVEPVPYQGMLKKLSPEEKAVLESGSTIGSRQAKIQRKLNQVKTTDADLYLAGGRKLSEDEKSLWKRTGKLSTDWDAPYYEMDYAKKNTGQLVKQNVGIVSGKGMLKALRTVSETKGKLKDKAFGKRFVPLESKSLAPDPSTYSQFVERDIGQLPYGKSVRTTGFDDNVAALFAVSQSDSMVQGQMGGGIIVTPVQEAMSTGRIIRENPLNAGQANFGKGLEANKGSNYDRMLAQARGKDANNFGGGTVERDFKERMVEQIYSKILKKEKPKPEAMNLYLEAGSPQYTKLIDDTVRTNNSNLKRMSKKETVKMNIKNKGRKVKKEVINPDSFEKIIGKVNLDTRNPIRRVTDAFKYRTQYRTEPEFFKEGSTYVVDGKTSSQYYPSKTDTGTTIKRSGWFGRLAKGIGERRKNNYQVTESKMAFQRQALREVLAEPIFQPYIGTDKTITRLFDDVMSMGETSFEGSVESVLRGQTDTANMSKNVQLNKLLGRLEATQLRLDKRLGKDKDKAKHQNVDRDRTTTTTTSLGPEKSLDLRQLIASTTRYFDNINPKLNKAKEQRDVYGKMVSTGEMTSKVQDIDSPMYGRITTRKLDKQEMIDAKNNLKFAKEDFDDLTNQLRNPDYLASLKKIKKLEAERKTKTIKNTVINTNTVTLGPDVPPQFYIDSQINAKKIREVKAEIAKSATDPDFDLARQSGDSNESFSNLGMTERNYTFDKDGNMKVNSPSPKNTWADKRVDSVGAESQDAWYNVGADIWKSPGNEDQRIRLGTSETANELKPDFSLPEGGAFIDGTKPSPTTDARLNTLDKVKDSTRGFLMRQTGLIGDGGETSMSRKAAREAKPGNLDWMLEPIEKSSKKKLTNVIDADNPVKSLAAYLDNAENTKQFSTPAFKDASEKLQTKQVLEQSSKEDTYSRGSSKWGTQSGFAIESSRVSKMDMDQVRQGIRADNKPDGVGIKQQVPL